MEATVNELFPIFVRLKNRRTLVVGGGPMAALRVNQLLKAGARVTLISPEVQPELAALVKSAPLQIIPRAFVPADVSRDYFVVIGATDDATVQNAIAEEAERCGILCNVVDNPRRSNFYTPAVVERGDLKIAISTNGKSPLLAGRLRQWLEEALPAEMGALTDTLGHLRKKLKLAMPGDLKKQKELLNEFLEGVLKK